MSRKDLLEACRGLRIRTEWLAGGKRGSKDNNWLRTDIIDRTYGPGMHWQFNSTADADQTCARAAACCMGAFGNLLSMSQHALRVGNEQLVEYKRLCGLKRRNACAEASALSNAQQRFEQARNTHRQFELEGDKAQAVCL